MREKGKVFPTRSCCAIIYAEKISGAALLYRKDLNGKKCVDSNRRRFLMLVLMGGMLVIIIAVVVVAAVSSVVSAVAASEDIDS